MSEEKSPIDRALDVFVYAPIGFVTFMRNMLPGWIEQGREEVNKQVTTARMMGEYAVSQAQKDAERAVTQTREVVENLAARVQDGRAGAPPARPAESSSPATSTATSTPSSPSSPEPPAKQAADHLAIPGYDALSASQVVERLPGLSAAELNAVREYEAATRGRRTIINKVGQLQGESA